MPAPAIPTSDPAGTNGGVGRGSIAAVWVPHELWVNGNTSRCGVNVSGSVKVEDERLVSNSMGTVEAEACVESPQLMRSVKLPPDGHPLP